MCGDVHGETYTLGRGVLSGSGMVKNNDVIVLGGSGEDVVELAGIWTEQFSVHDTSPFLEGEAEHEKITKKGYVCIANNHRQKKAACSEPTLHLVFH